MAPVRDRHVRWGLRGALAALLLAPVGAGAQGGPPPGGGAADAGVSGAGRPDRVHPAPYGAWPHAGGGPARTRASLSRAPVERPAHAWSFRPRGTIAGEPRVDGGRVLVEVLDAGGARTLHLLDLETGAALGPPQAFGPGPELAPAFAGSVVVVRSAADELAGLRPTAAGLERFWSHAVDGPLGPPVLFDDRVVFTAGRSLRAIDLGRRSESWSIPGSYPGPVAIEPRAEGGAWVHALEAFRQFDGGTLRLDRRALDDGRLLDERWIAPHGPEVGDLARAELSLLADGALVTFEGRIDLGDELGSRTVAALGLSRPAPEDTLELALPYLATAPLPLGPGALTLSELDPVRPAWVFEADLASGAGRVLLDLAPDHPVAPPVAAANLVFFAGRAVSLGGVDGGAAEVCWTVPAATPPAAAGGGPLAGADRPAPDPSGADRPARGADRTAPTAAARWVPVPRGVLVRSAAGDGLEAWLRPRPELPEAELPEPELPEAELPEVGPRDGGARRGAQAAGRVRTDPPEGRGSGGGSDPRDGAEARAGAARPVRAGEDDGRRPVAPGMDGAGGVGSIDWRAERGTALTFDGRALSGDWSFASDGVGGEPVLRRERGRSVETLPLARVQLLVSDVGVEYAASARAFVDGIERLARIERAERARDLVRPTARGGDATRIAALIRAGGRLGLGTDEFERLNAALEELGTGPAPEPSTGPRAWSELAELEDLVARRRFTWLGRLEEQDPARAAARADDVRVDAPDGAREGAGSGATAGAPPTTGGALEGHAVEEREGGSRSRGSDAAGASDASDPGGGGPASTGLDRLTTALLARCLDRAALDPAVLRHLERRVAARLAVEVELRERGAATDWLELLQVVAALDARVTAEGEGTGPDRVTFATEHLRLTTDLGRPGAAASALARVERLARTMAGWFAARGAGERPTGPLELRLFADRAAFVADGGRPTGHGASPFDLAVHEPGSGLVRAVLPARGAPGWNDAVAGLLHASAHQGLVRFAPDSASAAVAAGRGPAPGALWLVEGLAGWAERIGPDLPFEALAAGDTGEPLDRRTALLAALDDGELLAWERVVRLGPQAPAELAGARPIERRTVLDLDRWAVVDDLARFQAQAAVLFAVLVEDERTRAALLDALAAAVPEPDLEAVFDASAADLGARASARARARAARVGG